MTCYVICYIMLCDICYAMLCYVLCIDLNENKKQKRKNKKQKRKNKKQNKKRKVERINGVSQ